MASLDKQLALLARREDVFFESIGADALEDGSEPAFHDLVVQHLRSAQNPATRGTALRNIGEIFEQIALAYADECIGKVATNAIQVEDVA